jgi:hypothetical protein
MSEQFDCLVRELGLGTRHGRSFLHRHRGACADLWLKSSAFLIKLAAVPGQTYV